MVTGLGGWVWAREKRGYRQRCILTTPPTSIQRWQSCGNTHEEGGASRMTCHQSSLRINMAARGKKATCSHYQCTWQTQFPRTPFPNAKREMWANPARPLAARRHPRNREKSTSAIPSRKSTDKQWIPPPPASLACTREPLIRISESRFPPSPVSLCSEPTATRWSHALHETDSGPGTRPPPNARGAAAKTTKKKIKKAPWMPVSVRSRLREPLRLAILDHR